MPTKNQMFPSKYLKAEDFKGRGDVLLTIRRVDLEEIDPDDATICKPVVYFQEEKKGLILNKTNWTMIEEVTGEADCDNWVGKQITLYVDKTHYKGDLVDCTRVRYTQATTKAPDPFAVYGALYGEARRAGLPNIGDFHMDPSWSEEETMKRGKALRAAIDAHKAEDGDDDSLPF